MGIKYFLGNEKTISRSRPCLAIFLITTTLTVLSGCKSDETTQFAGRYQGILALNSQKSNVVAIAPYLQKSKENDEYVVNISVFEVLAKTKNHEFKFTFKDKTRIYVESSLLPGQRLKLVNRKDDDPSGCLKGFSRDFDLSLCLNHPKIQLEVKAKDRSQSISLNLEKNTLLAENVFATPEDGMDLDHLVGRAKFQNYSVSQEAEKVFQAGKQISVARGNLLPKLSLKSILGVLSGDILSMVGDFAPFLFPSNWYRWEASKYLYKAEKMSFAALRGNEMNLVEGMYQTIARDKRVLAIVVNRLKVMRALEEYLQKEESINLIPSGATEYFHLNILAIEKDLKQLNSLLVVQKSELAHATALNPDGGIQELKPLDQPFDLSSIPPLESSSIVGEVTQKSFEIKTLEYLLEAAKKLKGEALFGFLSPDSSNSLGFGTSPTMNIENSKQREILIKIDETKSGIKLGAVKIAQSYNLSLDNYRLNQKSIAVTEKRIKWLLDKNRAEGSSDFVDQLIELQNKLTDYMADQVTTVHVFYAIQSKLDRMLLRNFYSDLEIAIPEEKMDK